ncbi:MAG: VCBS repeat-containing protein, partial [Planctomycetota bacterium]|nr:VCBS repeat-containing protein [Planctomycetota bacterium]
MPAQAEVLEVRTLLSAVLFDSETIADSESTPHDIDGVIAALALDLDGDGDADIVTASNADESINWYKNLDGTGNAFAAHVIAEGFEPGTLKHADMDADGDQDIIAAISSEDAVAWFENRLSDGLDFLRHDVGLNIDRPSGLDVADLDGDGAIDVLVTSFGDDWAAWYENPVVVGGDFTRHEIADNINGAVAILAADFDGDLDLDVVVAGYYADSITLFENISGDGTSFRSRSVATNLNGVTSITAADFDGDLDIDIASAARHDDAIHWHEQ